MGNMLWKRETINKDVIEEYNNKTTEKRAEEGIHGSLER